MVLIPHFHKNNAHIKNIENASLEAKVANHFEHTKVVFNCIPLVNRFFIPCDETNKLMHLRHPRACNYILNRRKN